MIRLGNYTMPEDVEKGEYVVDSFDYYSAMSEIYFIVLVTEYYNGAQPDAIMFGGIPFNGGAYLCENGLAVQHLIAQYGSGSSTTPSSAIYDVYIVPKICIQNNTIPTGQEYVIMNDEITAVINNYNVLKPTTLDSYTPVNKKLLTYPYCYLLGSNNNGSCNIYYYEKFKDDNTANPPVTNCNFRISGIPVPRCKYQMYAK